jgi:hypothetical protein
MGRLDNGRKVVGSFQERGRLLPNTMGERAATTHTVCPAGRSAVPLIILIKEWYLTFIILVRLLLLESRLAVPAVLSLHGCMAQHLSAFLGCND